MRSNYYDILGIPHNASKGLIKRMFKTEVAHEVHPDHGGDKNDFLLARKAYNILSDDRLRLLYDQALRYGIPSHKCEVCNGTGMILGLGLTTQYRPCGCIEKSS